MTQDSFIFSLSIIFIGFIASLALTERMRRSLIMRALVDMPNDRSSHSVPVPRGGGWAILAILIPALIGAIGVLDGNMQHVGLCTAVTLLAIVSWIDDQRHLNPIVRLVVHLIAAYLGSLSFPADATLFHGQLPFWVDRAILIVGWAWFINLYNFMDGIDGITAAQTITTAIGVSITLVVAGVIDPYITFISLILIGVCLGFLAHNWHPAKIFLGDVGSIPLGFLVGFILIFMALNGYPAAAVILPLYYLVDSGITLLKRIAQRKKIWEAHREHFYQTAAIRAGGHDKIVYMIIAANLCLIGAAVLSVDRPWPGVGAGLLIVAVLLIKMHKIRPKPVMKKGRPVGV